MDGETTTADICGNGSKAEVRVFAHELRKQLWTKIFGIGKKHKSIPALQNAILKPGHPTSQKTIQHHARQNRELYEHTFKWIPRNESEKHNNKITYGHILPTWDENKESSDPTLWPKGNLSSPMPFQPEFWQTSRQIQINANRMNEAKGYIVELPIYWTKDENNRFDFPSTLVANLNSPLPSKGITAIDDSTS